MTALSLSGSSKYAPSSRRSDTRPSEGSSSSANPMVSSTYRMAQELTQQLAENVVLLNGLAYPGVHMPEVLMT